MGHFRDRIKELRRVRAGDLRPCPWNWRDHPPEQREALEAILAEVGFAGAGLARELEDGSLELIDGHMRAELDLDQEMPVLILDVTEEEAKKILATHDPLGAMSTDNVEARRRLLEEIDA
ncbi:MAG: ParB N-terminal domain-containing protein, partial [Thermoguttaceae bacterium]